VYSELVTFIEVPRLPQKNEMAKTILVADDNPTLRRALCKIFEVEKDYDLCAEAVDGAQAIALARQCRPDLIILDLNMPVINGIDAARELKRIMPHVPIIVLTIHAETVKNYLMDTNSPFDLVVSKIEAENIVNHVRSLIPVN
jgi:CheY-like chemotaxis protein